MEPTVAVLVSSGRHPVSGKPRACPGDVAALEVARGLGGDLSVYHLGQADDPALRDYLAFGAGRVVTLAGGKGAIDQAAKRLKALDVIVTGSRAEHGEGSGLLPYTLAQNLGRPIVANVLEASVDGREAIVRQFLPKGKRRRIAVQLPAVLSVHPLAPVAPRYAYARTLNGRIESVAASGASPDAAGGPDPDWTLSPADRQLVRLKALEKKAGHARMLSAVAAEVKSGVVAIEGSDVEKAQMLLAYLRDHRLIDF